MSDASVLHDVISSRAHLLLKVTVQSQVKVSAEYVAYSKVILKFCLTSVKKPQSHEGCWKVRPIAVPPPQ